MGTEMEIAISLLITCGLAYGGRHFFYQALDFRRQEQRYPEYASIALLALCAFAALIPLVNLFSKIFVLGCPQ